MIYLLGLVYVFAIIPAIGYVYGWLGYEYYKYWRAWKVGFFFSVIATILNVLWEIV